MGGWAESGWFRRLREELNSYLIPDLAFVIRCYVSTPYKLLVADLKFRDRSPELEVCVYGMVFYAPENMWLLTAGSRWDAQCIVSWSIGQTKTEPWAGCIGSEEVTRMQDGHRLLEARFMGIEDICIDPLTNDVWLTDNGTLRSIRGNRVSSTGYEEYLQRIAIAPTSGQIYWGSHSILSYFERPYRDKLQLTPGSKIFSPLGNYLVALRLLSDEETLHVIQLCPSGPRHTVHSWINVRTKQQTINKIASQLREPVVWLNDSTIITGTPSLIRMRPEFKVDAEACELIDCSKDDLWSDCTWAQVGLAAIGVHRSTTILVRYVDQQTQILLLHPF